MGFEGGAELGAVLLEYFLGVEGGGFEAEGEALGARADFDADGAEFGWFESDLDGGLAAGVGDVDGAEDAVDVFLHLGGSRLGGGSVGEGLGEFGRGAGGGWLGRG